MRTRPGDRGRLSRPWMLGSAFAVAVAAAIAGFGAVGGCTGRSWDLSFRRGRSRRCSLRIVHPRRRPAEGDMPRRGPLTAARTGLTCTEVVVPLDRSGVVPGSITLHVESVAAEGTERGVMMLIAGGPGQGSASVFGLGDKDSVGLFRALFPGYRIVAFDNRGTGKSGLLDCPALQRSTGFAGQETIARACATSIGSNRDFYSTHDHADDIDAVRSALGVDRIAMWGISYGTKLALAYALAYPTHVDRILLDSVLPTEYPDPFQANVLRDIPRALANYCGTSACRAATSDYARDVTAVANALAAHPAAGTVRRPAGGTRKVTVGGLDVLSVLVESDLNPGLAALLPAAIHAARTGDRRPLLRLHDLNVARFHIVGRGAQRRTQCGHELRRRALPVGSCDSRRRSSRPLRRGRRGVAARVARRVRPVGRRPRHGELLPRMAEPRQTRSCPSGRGRCRTSRCLRSTVATTCGRRRRARST